MTRTANPRGSGSRLRDELLDAATRLLDAGGRDAALTLRGVAREAGVAAPSVYAHFPDLDALVLELIRRHMADLAGRVRGAVAVADGARTALRAAAHAYVAWGLERPGPYTVVFEGRALRQLSRDEELALTAGEDLLADLVALLQAVPATAGARSDADAARAALAVWSGLHGVVALRTAKPAYPWPPLEEHADAVIEPYL